MPRRLLGSRDWKLRLAWKHAFARRPKRFGWSLRQLRLHRACFGMFCLRHRIAIMRVHHQTHVNFHGHRPRHVHNNRAVS